MSVATYLRGRPVWWWAAFVFAAAVVYRLYLTLQASPALGGDESVIGVMALHISRGEQFPVFFYGQHYMGPLEAYIAAPLVALLGPQLVSLRLATLLLYAVFFWAMFWGVRRTFGDGFALATCVVLAFGSDRVMRHELHANGGLEEMLAFGALLLGLTSWLCTRRHRREVWVFGLWGLVAGLCVWASPMIAPFLAAYGIVLVVFRWRRIAGWAAASAGFLVGILPMVGHNLRLPAGGRNTVSDLLGYNPPVSDFRLVDHLNGVVHGIGLGTGMCSVHCESWQLRWWPPLYLVLLATAATAAVWLLLRLRGGTDRDGKLRYALLLALVAAGAATLFLFFRSVHSGMPRGETGLVWQTSRYLSNLLLVTPAVLWPVWVAARSRWRLAKAAGVAVAAGILFTAGTATVSTLTDGLADERATQRRHVELMAELDRRGVTRLYSDYFSCWKLIYNSGERIICSPIQWDTLSPGEIRFHRYQAVLDAEPRPAYVFETGTRGDTGFRQLLAAEGISADVSTAGVYTIYLPQRRPSKP